MAVGFSFAPTMLCEKGLICSALSLQKVSFLFKIHAVVDAVLQRSYNVSKRSKDDHTSHCCHSGLHVVCAQLQTRRMFT